jgi:hypothetical protein
MPNVLEALYDVATVPPAPPIDDAAWGGRITRWPWTDDPNATNWVPTPNFDVLQANGITPVGWGFSNTTTTTVTNEHPTVGKSIRISGANLTTTAEVAQFIVPNLPRGRYSLRAKMKAVLVSGGSASAGGLMFLYTTIHGGTEQIAVPPLVSGTTDGWVDRYKTTFYWEGGQVIFQFKANLDPSGDIFLADPSLKQVEAPPSEMIVRYPNYMGHLWSDDVQEITVTLTGAPGTLLLKNTLHTTVASQAVASDGTVTMSLPALPDGHYVLTWSTATDDRYLPQWRIVKHPKSAMPTRVDPDQVWVQPDATGTPTRRFAVLIYDATGFPPTKEGWTANLSPWFPQLKADCYLNFKLIGAPYAALTNLGLALRDWGMTYWDTVGHYDIDGEPAGTRWPPDDSFFPSLVNIDRVLTLGDQPGIAGWYTADEREPDSALAVWRLEQMVREYAPNQPSAVAHDAQKLYMTENIEFWDDIQQLHWPDPYPCRNNNFDVIDNQVVFRLNWTSTQVRAGITAVAGARPVWGILQFWGLAQAGWPTFPPFWTFPNPAELRIQTWLAICAGAQGVGYWALHAWAGLSATNRAIMKEALINIVDEVKIYEQALIAERVSPPTVPTGILAIARHLGATTYVFTINNTNTTITDGTRTWARYDTQFWEIPDIEGGLLGTLTVTQEGDTLAADGVVEEVGSRSGVLTVTEAADTMVATGTVAEIGTRSGIVVLTEADDTVAGTGALAVGGAFTATEAADTVVATGELAAVGNTLGLLMRTEDSDTLVAKGITPKRPARELISRYPGRRIVYRYPKEGL